MQLTILHQGTELDGVNSEIECLRSPVEIYLRSSSKSTCVCSYLVLTSMWSVEEKVCSEGRGMVQGWLDGCSMVGLRTGFLKRNLGLD